MNVQSYMQTDVFTDDGLLFHFRYYGGSYVGVLGDDYGEFSCIGVDEYEKPITLEVIEEMAIAWVKEKHDD